jgi:hypothetical protein
MKKALKKTIFCFMVFFHILFCRQGLSTFGLPKNRLRLPPDTTNLAFPFAIPTREGSAAPRQNRRLFSEPHHSSVATMGSRKDCCGARRGTSFEAKSWLSLDVCGCIGVTLSFSVHFFAFGTILCHLIADSLVATAIFLLLYMPAFLLALASLFMAW